MAQRMVNCPRCGKPVNAALAAQQAAQQASQPSGGAAPAAILVATKTFTDTWTEKLGDETITAKTFTPAHTSGDAVVYFPEQKVVHTGDLFLSCPRPPDKPPGAGIYVDYAQGGSFMDWTRTLDGALTLDFDTVIPGHGAVSTRQDVVQFRSDLETMRSPGCQTPACRAV